MKKQQEAEERRKQEEEERLRKLKEQVLKSEYFEEKSYRKTMVFKTLL